MSDPCLATKAATKNAELNAVLARTDYAAAALRQTQAQLEDAQNRLRRQQALLESQQRQITTLAQEQEGVEMTSIQYALRFINLVAAGYRRRAVTTLKYYSCMRQPLSRACRLLTQADSQARPQTLRHDIQSVRAFIVATEACKRSETRIRILAQQVKQLSQQESSLRADAEAHERAQVDLKAMRRHMFSEQPLEVPEGPQQMKVAAIKAELNVLTQRVASQERATELLLGAVNAMAACKQKLKHALEVSEPLPPAATAGELLTRSAVAAATMHSEAAALFIDEARGLDPDVTSSPPAIMATPDFVSNILLDHIACVGRTAVGAPALTCRESGMRDGSPAGPPPTLQVAQAEAMISAAQLSTATHAAQTRLFDAKAAAKRQAGVLHAERDALRMLRLTLLEEVTGMVAPHPVDTPRPGRQDSIMSPRLAPRAMPAAEGPAAVSGE